MDDCNILKISALICVRSSKSGSVLCASLHEIGLVGVLLHALDGAGILRVAGAHQSAIIGQPPIRSHAKPLAKEADPHLIHRIARHLVGKSGMQNTY